MFKYIIRLFIRDVSTTIQNIKQVSKLSFFSVHRCSGQAPDSFIYLFLLQDLEEGLQVIRVGSVGVRWVLMQHADPWLLTVNCKQLPHSTSERRPFLKSRHNIPFMRKRCSREQRRETEEPPAKKPAVDTDKVSDRVNTGEPSNVTEIPDEEEQQQETAGGGDKPQSLEEEEEVQSCSEEKMETGHRQETRRRTRSSLDNKRAKEADSLPSGSADEE